MADSKDDQGLDLVVIGGGPAGYIGAIRAAQLGMRVACVERDRLGGVCLNWGCIPTKALLAGAEFYHRLKHDAADWGVLADNVRHDWSRVIGRSRSVAGTLNKGVGGLFKKNKIEHVQGHAFIPEPGRVQVYAPDDPTREGKVQRELRTKRILIATGAQPRALPGVSFDGQRVISSKEAMTLESQPDKLLIVGAGAIGMEFAYFYNAFGTQVTVVEMLDRALPVEDRDASAAVRKSFEKAGVKILTGHKTAKVELIDEGVRATLEPVENPDAQAPPKPGEKSYSARQQEHAKAPGATASAAVPVEADRMLIAIGVRGRYDGLFDDSLGLDTVKEHLKVDYKQPGSTYQTSVKGIFAVGDVIGPPWLAHVASEEAVVCVERMADHPAHDIDYDAIPGCTYCQPQVASIGLTEERAKEQGLDLAVGKFPFMASGKAQALGRNRRLRQAHHRPEARRSAGLSHGRRARHRAHRRGRPGDEAGGHRRRNHRHHPRPPDPQRSRPRIRVGHAGANAEFLIFQAGGLHIVDLTACGPANHLYSAGSTSSVSSVDVSSPPITTVARGFWTSLPVPVAMSRGCQAQCGGDGGHEHRAEAEGCTVDRRLVHRLALFKELIEVESGAPCRFRGRCRRAR